MNNFDTPYYVYLTTNLVNGKQYVGEHMINNTRREYYIGSGLVFRQAIKEHGYNNFFKEILEWHDNREDAFNSQEKYIKEFNTLAPNGYNISPVGGLGIPGWCSKETRNKIRNTQRGRKQSMETILKRIATIKERYSGVKRKASEETKKKLSDSHKGPRPWRIGKPLPPLSEERKTQLRNYKHTKETKDIISKRFSKSILQYDLKGNFIMEYESGIRAAENMGCSQRSICAAASPNNRQKTAKGFIWKYKIIENDK